MHWPQTGSIQYQALLGLPTKGRAIKVLVVCNNWDLEPLDLLNGLALGCYQPSTGVLIVLRVLSNLQAKGYTKTLEGYLFEGDNSFFKIRTFFSHICVLYM